MIQGVVTTQPFTFDLASDALTAALSFECSTIEFYQYDVVAVFDGPRRNLIGYQVRLKDGDGFGIGWIMEKGATA